MVAVEDVYKSICNNVTEQRIICNYLLTTPSCFPRSGRVPRTKGVV